MFCPLALGVLDTLVWWFEIAFMATLFEIEGHFNFEVTDQRSDIFSNGVILAELLLGQNMFAGSGAAESRQKIIDLPMPQFRNENEYIDLRLDAILQKALAHDLEIRYNSAERLMKDLEYHMYHNGCGPTKETFAKYMKELFPDKVPAAGRWAKRVTAPGFCSACSGTYRAKGHCRLRSSRRNTEPA